MSYEGYFQFVCVNGHYYTQDCYCIQDDYTNEKCPECGEGAVWWNSVDVTNGSFDEAGNRIDGYIELEIKEQAKCDKCNSVLETKYIIPEDRGKHYSE